VRVARVQGAQEQALVLALVAQRAARADQQELEGLGLPAQAERVQAHRQAARAIQPVVPRREGFVAIEATSRQAGKEKTLSARDSGPAPRLPLLPLWQPALPLPAPVAALEELVGAEMVIQYRGPYFERSPLSASTQPTLAMGKHLP
jgi:hypothetical protein